MTAATFPQPLIGFVRLVDRMNYGVGRFAMYLLFALMAVLMWSSISKTFFNPSLWTLEMAQFVMVAYYILGGPYAMQMGAHVRMDLFYAKQAPRTRAAWDGFTVFALIFYLGVMIWGAAESFGYSLGLRWEDGLLPEIGRLERSDIGRNQRHHQQHDLGQRDAARGRGARVHHLEVEVVAQRIGHGQQQPVGGRQRRGQRAGGHQTRDHERQARDLGRGQHDHVAAQAEFVELQQAVGIDVLELDQAGVDPAPGRDPGRQLIDRGADQLIQDLVLDQHGQRRRREDQHRGAEQAADGGEHQARAERLLGLLHGLPGRRRAQAVEAEAVFSGDRAGWEPLARGYKAFSKAFELGLMVRQSGDAIAMSPPLVIEKAQIDEIAGTLGAVLRELA